MKVAFLASFFVLSLLCGVQGQPKCVAIDNDNYWDAGSGDTFCGCEFQDAGGQPMFNISLDFFDTVYVYYHK